MKVTKKRLMSGLSILCALMILIGIMPLGVFASTTETYNSNCIYFNISNIIGSGHNESEWNNGPVYVYKSSWNSFDQMVRVSGTNVYKLDVSDWKNRDQSGSLIFTTKKSWDEIKASDYRRTSEDSSVNLQTAMGKEFSWNGSGVAKIDDKNTFDMTKSSVSVGSVIGGVAPADGKTIYFDATLSKLRYSVPKDYDVSTNYIYFDANSIVSSNMNNGGNWSNNVWVLTNGGFKQMNKIANNVYRIPTSEVGGTVLFSTSTVWNTLDYQENFRTQQTDFNSSSEGGAIFSWGGSWDAIGDGKVYPLSIKKDVNSILDYSMPKTDGGTIRYYATGGGSDIKGTMSIVSGTNNNIYKVTLPSGYTNIAFSTFEMSSSTNYGGHGESTQLLSIPSNLTNPCFFADTSDNVIYNDSNGDHQRGGYWAEYDTTVRDAGKGKGTDVVDIQPSSFTSDKNINALYLNSTFYDYYTDYELNGNNRDDYKYNNGASQRNWVPFRQFDQALSDFYKSNNVSYPVYTGHFQPDYSNWGTRFSEIAGLLNLYGYSSNKEQFFAINNSTLDNTASGSVGSGDRRYAYTTQGLTANTLSNGNLMVADGNVALPHFNEDFINGNNSKNTKLGEVYNNVAFPFTQRKVFVGDDSDYWWFDSAITTLSMREDNSGSEYDYYLHNNRGNLDNSKNVDSSSTPVGGNQADQLSNVYGFFPFNETSTATHANTYNYGFGTKIEFDFYVSGNINQQFLFSGDDDVWVYVDDQLILDVGGAHGQVSGLIDFKEGKTYVSQVKKGASQGEESYFTRNEDIKKDIDKSKVKKSITYSPKDGTSEVINFSQEKSFSLNSSKASNGGLHKLTFYYMERGMWESNMKIAFNMPPVPAENELQLTKTVDTANTNELFKNSFNNVSFDMDVKNLATHYGTASVSTGENKSEDQIADYGSATTNALKSVNGAYYTNNTLKQVSNGKVSLKANETATFSNQFRRGSYLSINEQLSDKMSKLFTSSWNMYENSDCVRSKTSSGFDDGRIEPKIDGKQTGNAYNGSKPNANTFVFKSYNADNEQKNARLALECVNKVNVGSLSVKKTGDSKLDNQDFNFAIKFSDVGGIDASASTDTVSFTLECNGTDNRDVYVGSTKVGKIENGTFIMTGIPVGTKYTIYETKRTGVTLISVNGLSSGFSFDSSTGKYAVTGTITAKGTAYNYNFGNKKDVVNVEITKTWNGKAYDATKHSNVPDSIAVTLEKSENKGSTWTQVSDYSKITLSKNNGFKATVNNLEKYSNSGVEIQYRVKELDSSDSVINGGGYCNYNDKYYQVTYPSPTTENGVIKLSVDNTSYGFKIQKFGVPSDTTTVDWSSADKLKGAKFKVTATISGTTYKYEVETNDDGIAELNGIVLGTYTVEEIEAPEGYKLNEHKYTVTINTRGFSVSNTDALSSADYSNKIIKIADNEKVVIILPGTGGEGTETNVFNFALFGVIAIIISGGMWLLLNKKIKSGKAM